MKSEAFRDDLAARLPKPTLHRTVFDAGKWWWEERCVGSRVWTRLTPVHDAEGRLNRALPAPHIEVDITSTTPGQCADRVSGLVTVTVIPASAAATYGDYQGIVARVVTEPIKPAPEPILSLGGEEWNPDELLEALKAVRAKRAPAASQTPRGLLIVRPLDHRLGLWNGEGV